MIKQTRGGAPQAAAVSARSEAAGPCRIAHGRHWSPAASRLPVGAPGAVQEFTEGLEGQNLKAALLMHDEVARPEVVPVPVGAPLSAPSRGLLAADPAGLSPIQPGVRRSSSGSRNTSGDSHPEPAPRAADSAAAAW